MELNGDTMALWIDKFDRCLYEMTGWLSSFFLTMNFSNKYWDSNTIELGHTVAHLNCERRHSHFTPFQIGISSWNGIILEPQTFGCYIFFECTFPLQS